MKNVAIAVLCSALILPLAVCGQLKINEVYYNVAPQGGNQFVELKNVGLVTEYLDGKVLTDEAGSGTEGVYQFPGSPGGTNLPVLAGARVVIAVDASGDTSAADWECYAGGADFDNPSVSNLVRVSGSDDLGFFSGGDNCILATGSDVQAPIDAATIIDGMNFGDGGGESAPLSSASSDANPSPTAPESYSLQRCPESTDGDYASTDDFFPNEPTRGLVNLCQIPFLSITDVAINEGHTGTNPAVFRISLYPPSASTVTVTLETSNGTATAGSDYFALSTQLVFTAGVTSLLASVDVLGDFAPEPSETFFARLFSITNGALLDPVGVGTIIDDDGGAISFTSRIIRIAGPAQAVTSEWISVPGKAYLLQSTTNFPAGFWTDVGGTVTATLSTMIGVDTAAATSGNRRVYRVIQFD